MKTSRGKIISVAVVLVLGYVLNSYAYRIQISKDRWADFIIRGQLFYYNWSKRSDEIDYRQNYFEMTEAEFYVKGQINKFVQFFTQWESYYKPHKLNGEKRADATATVMKETGMNLVFCPEFKIRFGRQRTPVSRYHQRSDYKKLIPTDYFWRYDVHEVFTSKHVADLDVKKTSLEIRRPGMVVFGNLLGGMFRYHVGLFNQPNHGNNGNKGVRTTVRLAFTPTWLGYKPESSIKGTRGDSYLGKRDSLTLGIGYSREEIWDGLTNQMFAADAFWEKRFGRGNRYVPMLQCGYIYSKDTHKVGNDKKDSQFWWIGGQFLYNKFIGYGRPALAARFEQMNSDDAYHNKDLTYNRFSIFLNYFIKGYSAWFAIGIDHVYYTNGAKDYVLDNHKRASMTDFSTYFQFRF